MGRGSLLRGCSRQPGMDALLRLPRRLAGCHAHSVRASWLAGWLAALHLSGWGAQCAPPGLPSAAHQVACPIDQRCNVEDEEVLPFRLPGDLGHGQSQHPALSILSILSGAVAGGGLQRDLRQAVAGRGLQRALRQARRQANRWGERLGRRVGSGTRRADVACRLQRTSWLGASGAAATAAAAMLRLFCLLPPLCTTRQAYRSMHVCYVQRYWHHDFGPPVLPLPCDMPPGNQAVVFGREGCLALRRWTA